MLEDERINDEKIWVTFLRRHWKISFLFVIGAILAVIGAIFVFLWVVNEGQIIDLVPPTLDMWTMGHFISFLLHLLFWEAIFIGIPVAIAVVLIIFLWWKRLPDEERQEYKQQHLFDTESKKSDKSGGISFLIFIAFIIKIYLDGKWNVPIATWTFDYLMYSFLWAFIWIVIIIGIPLSVGLIWWIHHQIKRNRNY